MRRDGGEIGADPPTRMRLATGPAKWFTMWASMAAVAVAACSGPSDTAPDELPPPLSVAAEAPLVWEQPDVLEPGWVPEVVADGPGGTLVLASENGRPDRWSDAIALRSVVGVRWEAFEISLPQVVHIDGLVGTDTTFVAYGLFAGGDFTVTTVARPQGFPRPAVWTSVDGMGWDLMPLPLPGPADRISDLVSYSIFDAAVDGDLVVAVGTEFDEDLPDAEGDVVVPTRQVVWVSTGPGTWEPVDDDRLVDAEGAASGPAGIITTTRPVDGGIAVWNTRDGTTWDRLGEIPHDGFLIVLEGSPAGYVALAGGPDRGGRLWFSETGAAWRSIDEVADAVQVHGGRGGFVVIARDGVFWSLDGTTWGETAAPAADAFTSGAALHRHALVMAGQTVDGVGTFHVGTQPGP